MKYAKLIEDKIQIFDTDIPKLEQKGAIIKVFGCGLCGSDLVKIRNKKKDIVLGHEVVGEIVEINAPDSDFRAGDIVALGHHYPCLLEDCEFCKNKSYSMCPVFKKSNIFPCGFSEFIRVDENHLKYTVFKMNKDLNFDEMSFVEPLSCCIRAIRRAGFEYGADNSRYSALVVGLGSIGLLMMKGLSAFGVQVSGFDINEERMNFAKKEGFDFVEKKYDTVFLCAGHSKALSSALKYTIDGGKIIVFSSIENNEGFSNNEIYSRELSIIASYSPAPRDLSLSAELLNKKIISVHGLSTHYSLDKLACAVDDSLKGKVFKAYIRL